MLLVLLPYFCAAPPRVSRALKTAWRLSAAISAAVLLPVARGVWAAFCGAVRPSARGALAFEDGGELGFEDACLHAAGGVSKGRAADVGAWDAAVRDVDALVRCVAAPDGGAPDGGL